MINKIQRKLSVRKFQPGGINNLPTPFQPASPFSIKGMQQAWQRVPGLIRKPINFMVPKSHVGKAFVYGAPLVGALYSAGKKGVESAIANAPKPGDTINVGPGRSIPFQIPQEPAAKPVQQEDNSPLENAFPGWTNAEIIQGYKDDEGIKVAENQVPKVMEEGVASGNITTTEDLPPQSQLDTNEGNIPGDAPPIVTPELNAEIENRELQEKKATQMFFEEFLPDAIKSQQSGMGLQLDQTVRSILGDRGKKTKNLLLLQLAANLISGRTDQPGFKGFLDVVGQAGQNVIPMALALERSREEDELEIKKALIASRGSEKIEYPGKAEGIVVFTDENTKEIKRAPYHYHKGQLYATLTDADGLNARDVAVNNYHRLQKFPAVKEVADLTKTIQMYGNALTGVNQVLDIATKYPQEIGAVGSLQRLYLVGKDILAQAGGELDYSSLRAQLNGIEEQFDAKMAMDKSMYTEKEFEKLLKAGNRLFKTAYDEMDTAKTETGTLERQAKLRAVQLMTSYALANILKDKDRLAVRDIERAEKLTNVFGILSSPTDIIYAYVELKDQLERALQGKVDLASQVGISDAEIKKLKYQFMGAAGKRQKLEKDVDSILEPLFQDMPSIDELINKSFGNIQVIEPEAMN
jgi:hypothetical protein